MPKRLAIARFVRALWRFAKNAGLRILDGGTRRFRPLATPLRG
jgi:hypothetical protein